MITKGKFTISPDMEFGNWLVIRKAESGRHARWLCRCKCGAEKEVYESHLKSGASKGCKPCATVTHGLSKTPTWMSWMAMITRCTNKNHKKFALYGGRGIKVCDEWLTFENFLRDMGVRPDGKSLERKNGDLGYFKDNCTWASLEEQNNNRSCNRFVTIGGVTKTISQWCKQSGITTSALSYRISVGWPESMLLSPLRRRTSAAHGGRK